jgi:hypothetical protein
MTNGKKAVPLIKGKRKVDKAKAISKPNNPKAFGKTKSPHKNWEFKPNLENMGAVLHAIDPSVSIDSYNEWTKDWRFEIQKLIRNNGFAAGSRRVNLVRDYTLQLIEGRKPENPEWLATSEVHNVPSCLNEDFIDYIVGYLRSSRDGLKPDHKKYQVILTILNIQRLYEGLVEPSYDSIIKKPTAIDPGFLDNFSKFVEAFLNNKKKLRNYPRYDSTKVNFEEYRSNLSKSGPNGLPKLESAHLEAKHLCKRPLFQPFKKLSSHLGLEGLLAYVSLLAEIPIPDGRDEYKIKDDDVNLRKLIAVPDKGFKTRVVAICDFWTQLLLEPIRDHVQKVISFLFTQDYRLDQELGVEAMIQFQKDCMDGKTINGHVLDIKHLKFYDISAWTDRFHRDLQKITMKHLFDSKTSECWAQLTVHCEWYVPGLGTHIKYGQGQGMGTNGSFDIATLTDHLFIHFMYDQEGYSGIFENMPYGKVGDDLWIYDPSDSYQDYCEKINLPINIQKSKIYCPLGSIAEFCSRTAINGIDVSRVSPNVINQSNDFRNIPQLLSVCNRRDIVLNPSSFPSLQRKLKNKEERYIDMLQPWLISAVVVNLFLENRKSPYGFLSADYLTQNEWLVNEDVKLLVTDHESLIRIAIGNSIISILKSVEVIDTKVRSLRVVENSSMSYDDMDAIYNIDLFSTDCVDVNLVCENLGFQERKYIIHKDGRAKSALLPTEIFPVIRLKTLKKNLTVKLLEAHSLEGDKIEDILEFARLLNRISVSVDFNEGHINYEKKRVYNRQFSIVKYLSRSSSPYDYLELDNDQQKNLINSILSYEELPVEWVKSYLPRLTVRSTGVDPISSDENTL